jgi:uncharacterized protein (TIGR04255 family)
VLLIVIAIGAIGDLWTDRNRVFTKRGASLEKKASVLNLPEVARAQFKKNFIKTAICELRFPALLEFESKPPTQLQKELRKEFPHYERQQAVNIGDVNEKEIKHVLKSKKGEWLIAIRSYSIAVQTDRYTHFAEFSDMVKYTVNKALPFLDTDFFTRVGLRYVNEVCIEDGELLGWINDDLIAPIVHGVYGTVSRYIQEVRGATKSGQFTFRHGIAGLEEGKENIYLVDFDFYNANVQADDVIPMISNFNKEAFRFFQWAMGAKAQERLGKPMIPEDK